jgi:hypothetical protein
VVDDQLELARLHDRQVRGFGTLEDAAEGRNIRSDYRWATPGNAESIQRFAKELVALQPDLILSQNTATTATPHRFRAHRARRAPVHFPSKIEQLGTRSPKNRSPYRPI